MSKPIVAEATAYTFTPIATADILDWLCDAVDTARRVAPDGAWQGAITRAWGYLLEVETIQYDELNGAIKVASATEPGRFYVANGDCGCAAFTKGKGICWHRAAARLVKRALELRDLAAELLDEAQAAGDTWYDADLARQGATWRIGQLLGYAEGWDTMAAANQAAAMGQRLAMARFAAAACPARNLDNLHGDTAMTFVNSMTRTRISAEEARAAEESAEADLREAEALYRELLRLNGTTPDPHAKHDAGQLGRRVRNLRNTPGTVGLALAHLDQAVSDARAWRQAIDAEVARIAEAAAADPAQSAAQLAAEQAQLAAEQAAALAVRLAERRAARASHEQAGPANADDVSAWAARRRELGDELAAMTRLRDDAERQALRLAQHAASAAAGIGHEVRRAALDAAERGLADALAHQQAELQRVAAEQHAATREAERRLHLTRAAVAG